MEVVDVVVGSPKQLQAAFGFASLLLTEYAVTERTMVLFENFSTSFPLICLKFITDIHRLHQSLHRFTPPGTAYQYRSSHMIIHVSSKLWRCTMYVCSNRLVYFG